MQPAPLCPVSFESPLLSCSFLFGIGTLLEKHTKNNTRTSYLVHEYGGRRKEDRWKAKCCKSANRFLIGIVRILRRPYSSIMLKCVQNVPEKVFCSSFIMIKCLAFSFGRQNPADKQEVAVGESIIFTYDIAWKESETHWASRWDIYLTMNHAVKNRVRAATFECKLMFVWCRNTYLCRVVSSTDAVVVYSYLDGGRLQYCKCCAS